MSPLTRAQREAQISMGNVGARTPRPDRCLWCREFRGLRICKFCRQWFCWRHHAQDLHSCPGEPQR